MIRTICINLTAAEAKAWADGECADRGCLGAAARAGQGGIVTSERMMRHFYGASGFENNRLREAAFEDALEAAYWNMDTLRKRPGMPMSERDAFKAAVRAMLRKEGS